MAEKFIALIGAGYWGKNILKNLSELGVLASCCDSDTKALMRLKNDFPNVIYTNSLEEVLNDKNIKAVAIATPAVTHYEIAKNALLKNKDVFVEKPLALKVKQAQTLIGLARKKGRILMVGHILHYHPAVLQLRKMLSSAQFGKIHYVYSNRLNIGRFRTEENILWSFAPHDISVILMLIGEIPVKVRCFGGDYLNRGIYDTTLTTFEFKNGIKGHIFVSWLHPYKEQKLVLVGSQAMVVFDDTKEEKLFLYRHKIKWEEGKIPVAHRADYEVVPVKKKEPLKAELEHFIDCIKKRSKPETDGEEGLRVLKILALCEKSLSANRKEEERR